MAEVTNVKSANQITPLSERNIEELSNYSHLPSVQDELARRWGYERFGVDESESGNTELASKNQEAIAGLEAQIANLARNEQGLLRRQTQAGHHGADMWTQANASNLSGVQKALARARAQLVRIRAIQ